jgi:hypothetical protein
MVNSQEIVERTFYIGLLHAALQMGVTVNPDDYLPLSEANQARYEADKKKLSKFVAIFGMGNNQVRGAKVCPRITLELQGYYPGSLGTEKFVYGDKEIDKNYTVIEYPYEAKDITIDVHLVANTQADMRLLHTIMYRGLPARGYIKPYFNDYEDWKSSGLMKEGNIYLEVGNYYDHQDLDHGMLEKVYQYTCEDCIVDTQVLEDVEIVPIKDISILLWPDDHTLESDATLVHVP